ncbi:hypothetical protein [Persephonella sp.]
MGKAGFVLIFSVLALSIGGLGYFLYQKWTIGKPQYYRGDIKKTPGYYKGKMENSPIYYKGSLKKLPNYYKKDIKDLPNYYRPPSAKKESDRASRLRSLKENW